MAAPERCPERMCARSAWSSTTMPAGGVDEDRTGLHQGELVVAEEAGVAGSTVDVEADDVGLPEQLLQRSEPPGVAVRQPVRGVVEDDVEPDGLGDVGQLGADVAVPDDPEGLTPSLVAAAGGLVPDPVVHPLGLLGQPAGQRQHLAQHQLDDAPRVREGRVEHRHAVRGRRRQVDLVGADAEAADRQQVVGCVEDALRHLGVGPDPQQGHADQGVHEITLGQGPRPDLDVVTVASKGLDGDGVHVLQQQHLHVRLLVRDRTLSCERVGGQRLVRHVHRDRPT